MLPNASAEVATLDAGRPTTEAALDQRMNMDTARAPLGKRLAATAGYVAALGMIAVSAPIVQRHPVRSTVDKASRQVVAARSGMQRRFDMMFPPPPPPLTFGELILDAVFAALASRPPG